jgi:organic radical activating enzyme
MIESIRGFHIEPTNICTLKCPGCARTRFIDQWPQHWQNHSLDIIVLLQFLDIDLSDKRIELCGNYGDPIYHPDFIDFVKKFKNRGAGITIHTNGSYKKQDWWKELAELLTENDQVVFSVDGTPENFTKYRINADWGSIHTGMQVIAQATCDSVWKYIPFAFNQDNIEQVKRLSNSIGIKNFEIEFSDRFDQQTQDLKPTQDLIGFRHTLQSDWKSNSNNATVEAKCNNGIEHFVTADGFYTPCCFLADHRFYYKTPFGKSKPQYNIQQHTLTELLQRPQTVDFYNTLDQQPGCQYNCPKRSG